MVEIRKSRRFESPIRWRSAPATETLPDRGVRIPAMRPASVVFPLPLLPMTATFSPSWISKDGMRSLNPSPG